MSPLKNNKFAFCAWISRIIRDQAVEFCNHLQSWPDNPGLGTKPVPAAF